jgi:seryl-tRNA synthetase
MPVNSRKNHQKVIYAKSNRGPLPPRPSSKPQGSQNIKKPSRSPVQPPVRPAAPPQRVMPQRPNQVKPTLQTGVSGVTFTRSSALPHRPIPNKHPIGFHKAPSFRAVGQNVRSLASLNTASAHQDVSSEASSLNSALQNLQNRSSFVDLQTEILNLDSSLNKLSQLIDSARSKGYCFQSDLDEKAYEAASRWESARERVISAADQQAQNFQSRLPSLNPHIQRVNTVLSNPGMAGPQIKNARQQVDNLQTEVDRIQRSLKDQYSPIETQVRELTNRLNEIHWALDQLPEAKFRMEKGEDLVLAVSSRWDKEGKDDPEGVLYLTNKRLIYERKQKVATKKVLFITTASDLVHEVLVDQSLENIQSSKAEGKGLLGHQDFLYVQSAKMGNLAFHLRGQNGKMWQQLLEKARSGRLDRVVGAGVSSAVLNRTINNADILALQSEINQLQDEMMLKTARQDLAGLEADVASLGRRLSNLRSRGYAIEKDLEANVTLLTTQWERIKTSADAAIDQQTGLLGESMRSIQQTASQLMGMAGSADQDTLRSLYLQSKSSMASAESQADAARETVFVLYEHYRIEVENLSAHLDWVGWMLDALATASFQLSASEYGIAAIEAVWERPGLESENGVLYLTNNRLIWEDRVGAYELKVNVQIQQVSGVCKEIAPGPDLDNAPIETLVSNFGSGAHLSGARFLLSAPVADDWIKMVGRARSGGYSDDLAIKIDPEELERIKNAPTRCTSCGAAFTTLILRGQTEVDCDYCGARIRF